MASEVIAAALEEPPVCFATYGHPKLYCYPTTLIQRAAKLLDLKIAVLPGISSLDTLFVDLAVDPALDGLQIYDATDLLIRRRPIQIDVSCIILQPAIVLQAYGRQSREHSNNLALLQNYLLTFYPPKHVATHTITKTHPLFETVTQKIPIGRLANILEHGSNMGTLFIPPVNHREIADPALADRMRLPIPAAATVDEKAPSRPGRPIIGPRES